MDPLPHTADARTVRWPLPGGREALWDREAATWWRPGLEGPLQLPADDLALRPSLGVATAVAQFGHLQVVPAGPPLARRLTWPVAAEVLCGGVVVDRFRPDMSWTLLGPVGTGEVVEAARVEALAGPPPPWTAALHVTLAARTAEPATLRRVALPEAQLTLWRTEEGLQVGRLAITVDPDGHAEARGVLPEDVPAGDVLRAGAVSTLDGGGLRWLVDGTRRSLWMGWG